MYSAWRRERTLLGLTCFAVTAVGRAGVGAGRRVGRVRRAGRRRQPAGEPLLTALCDKYQRYITFMLTTFFIL